MARALRYFKIKPVTWQGCDVALASLEEKPQTAPTAPDPLDVLRVSPLMDPCLIPPLRQCSVLPAFSLPVSSVSVSLIFSRSLLFSLLLFHVSPHGSQTKYLYSRSHFTVISIKVILIGYFPKHIQNKVHKIPS